MFLRTKSRFQSGRSLKPSLRICLNILILLLFLTGFLCGCLPSEPQLSVPDPAVTNAVDENPRPSGTPSSAGSDSQAAETPPETTAPPEPDIPAEPQEPDILTLPAADRSGSARLANLTEGSVQIVDERLPCDSGTVLIRRSYFMPSGDLVLSGSLQETDHSASSERFAVPVFRIIREKACVHWYQSEKWFSAGSAPDSAESGTPPSGYYTANCLFLDTELEHLVIFLPKAYERLENSCVRYLPDRDGYLRISPTESGALEITLYAVCSGIRSFSDFYLACCNDPVLSWEKEDQRQAWSRCTGDIGGRFLHDGFYRTSPETYIPTGDNVYANCAASYCTRVFAEGADSFEAMKDLAFFMIDTTIRQQNSQGYWPSTAVSTWLLQDYRIGAGYYDTRFNSDFARILIAFYEQFGGDCIYDALSRYLDFYVLFVEQNAWEMFGGIVVPDYGYPGMITPHMALNHELAEMQVLYRASVLLNRPELEELADRLLTAIENSAYAWIAPDGNLHYGVFPDGRFGMWEYPYLTYNDLFEMQQLLEEKGRTRSPALDRMMDSKRVWMDRNGITEYKK